MFTLIDIRYIENDKELHVVVSSPTGGGSSYQVLINDYYRGSVVYTSQGWISYLNTAELYSADIEVIMETIKDHHPEKSK